jgi:hypothetical protein
MIERTVAPVTPLALRKTEAAEALGLSDESFDKHVRPTLPAVRIGVLRLFPVEAIERWPRDNQQTPLGDE